jgi:hypothetical protein
MEPGDRGTAADLRDPAVRRRRVVEALLGSPDPILREVGEQMRDGRVMVADAIRVPAYANALRSAAVQAARHQKEGDTP